MLYFYCVLLFIVLFFEIVTCERCHTAGPRSLGFGRQCSQPHKGCAMVQYAVDLQRFQTRGFNPMAHYMCLDNLQPLHPFFIVVNCPHSHNRATCYDTSSTALLEYDLANGIKMQEQFIGQVLKLHGIEKFCCCIGNECNKVNDEMVEFFVEPRDNFQERVDFPNGDYYPGGREVYSPGTRYYNSASNFYYNLSSFLLLTIIYFVFE